MRKFTVKIINDIWIKRFKSYSIKINNLNEKFRNESDFIAVAGDLIIKFPNLQISSDLCKMWTPDVNHLVEYVYLECDSDLTNGSICVFPLVIIDGYRIFGFDPNRAHIDGLYNPFYIANKNGADFENGITEVDGWKDNMRSLRFTEKIITEIETQLNRLVNKGNLKR